MEQSRPSDQLMAEGGVIAVAQHLVRTHVAAGEVAGPAGRAQGRGYERIGEGDAIAGDPVDVRRLHERVADATQRVESQVVDEDEDEVGARLVFRQQRRRHRAEGLSSG